MDVQAELAMAKQSFEAMLSLCEPRLAGDWKPSNEQRNAYIRVAESALDALIRLEQIEHRQLWSEGTVQNFVPEGMLMFVRDHMKPRVQDILRALDCLDPDGKPLREFFYSLTPATGPGLAVRATFEQGVQEVYNLLERNPDWDDHGFLPDTAFEVLDSKLVNFEPDAWLQRAAEIRPIRTTKSNVSLPVHIRFRLEELYRVYVFGCWLSVLGLSRPILEYAILNNLHKWSIEGAWIDRGGKRKDKKLSHLIEEVAEHCPALKEHMEQLRDLGNDYLHPNTSKVSKSSLFDRQQSAKQAMTMLVSVVEGLYLASKQA
jgi:hypothetical protein